MIVEALRPGFAHHRETLKLSDPSRERMGKAAELDEVREKEQNRFNLK